MNLRHSTEPPALHSTQLKTYLNKGEEEAVQLGLVWGAVRNRVANENRVQVCLRNVQLRLACRVREILIYDVVQKRATGYDCVAREGNIYGVGSVFSVAVLCLSESLIDVYTSICKTKMED